MIMELVITELEQCHLLEISGRIDSYSAPRIDEVLDILIDDHHYNLIVDLNKVSYISSSGLLTFVKTQRKFKQNKRGEIVFVNVPNLIFSSFELAGFNSVFAFYDDVAAAAGRF
jgi:anti-sigma B factor antagonist